MLQGLRTQAAILAFGLSLAAIYGAALWIVAGLGRLDRPELIAGALTLDLTLLVPGLYYLLVARPRGWPALTVVPVFLASVLIAGRLIPPRHHAVLDLLGYAAVAAELALVAIVAHKAVQIRRGYRRRAAAGDDLYGSLRHAAAAILGSLAGGVLAYEVAVFHYAIAGWRRSPAEDDRSFSVHRTTGYAALLIAVTIALVVETVAVHLLVRLWSPTLAWLLTAFSVYAVVWIAGDLHAVRLRPVRVSEGTLHVRVGLRWTIDVPREAIRAVGPPPCDAAPAACGGCVAALLLGAPNRRIELTRPVPAVGLYGRTRRVTTIDLWIDEPERFDAALARGR